MASASATTVGPAAANPFVCNVCQKTYGRIDHLARHFRSHTNEKPFKCDDCGKTFARADLLKRHAALHTVTEQSGKKRKIRASQACAACAAIKVKCDQEKPCRRCISKGFECRIDPASGSSTHYVEGNASPDGGEFSPQLVQPCAPGAMLSPTGRMQALGTGTHTPTMNNAPDTSGHATVPMVGDGSLTVFLRDVIHPCPPVNVSAQPRIDPTWNGNYTPRDLMDFSQNLEVDFPDLDTILPWSWDSWLDPSLGPRPVDKPTAHTISDSGTSSIDDSINLGSAAYSRSALRWIPNRDKVDQDQNLASILNDGQSPSVAQLPRQKLIAPPLDQQERDKIIAMLLTSCEKANFQKIVAAFPSVKVLDVFLNDFLLNMEHSIDGWIHIPTFKPNAVPPELLTMMIAGGAVLSKSTHAQRLGYALEEKARKTLWEMFEQDSSNTQDLQALQTYAIRLDIGTWSGNKRTMELAESSAPVLVTMIRRSGGFRRSRGLAPGPAIDDSAEVLEQKWKDWVTAESFKRLAYHVFIYCVQMSAAFQVPPLISYAEMTMELPAPPALWRARSAQAWKEQYFAYALGKPLPSMMSSMASASVMSSVRNQIDLELTLYLVLLSHWCLAWEFIQLTSTNKAQTSDQQWAGTLIASAKSAEIYRLLDSFYVAIEDWNVFVPKEVHMASQLLRMNLNVALEDLQLLAGKEGEDEARQVLPSLKQWSRSPESRNALWHAGQVLRAARRPAGRSPNASHYSLPDAPWLRDFNAVALYHAGLVLWIYGLLTQAIESEHDYASNASAYGGQQTMFPPPIDYNGELIRLDGDDEELTPFNRQQFISMGRGRPVISATSPFLRGSQAVNTAPSRKEVSRASHGPNTERVADQIAVVPLDDPKRVMEVIIHVLTPASLPPDSSSVFHGQCSTPQRPAMVENLMQLMRDLGEAASSV